ncbi:MAG TPA: Ser-Thr-rich GPI-anchored membrane family protein [Ignavibacteriales bacterium]|nr:Ser-Thr-rich GPI-anchored membrane family protein [Ignavibacteriales bacterium]
MFKKLLFPVFFISIILLSGCREKLNLTDPGPAENLLISSTDAPNVLYMKTPAGGEVMQKGSRFSISWFVSPAVKTVSLTLFRKTEEITGISGATENDGTFNWKIPTNIPASVHYRIRLSNTMSPDEYIFSEYFTIASSDTMQAF